MDSTGTCFQRTPCIKRMQALINNNKTLIKNAKIILQALKCDQFKNETIQFHFSKNF